MKALSNPLCQNRTFLYRYRLRTCPVERILVFGRFDEAEARVGKVDAVVLEGLDLWFNSSDHLPPHLHARRRGEWEIRVYFLLCTDDELVFDCKWAKKNPSAKVLARIRKAVVEHRVELLREWEQKVSREA